MSANRTGATRVRTRGIMRVLISCIVFAILSTIFFHQQKSFIYKEIRVTGIHSTNATTASLVNHVMGGLLIVDLNDTSTKTGTRRMNESVPGKIFDKWSRHAGKTNSREYEQRDKANKDVEINESKNDTKGLEHMFQRCFPHNSKQWLLAGSRRLGNYNDPLLDHEIAKRLLLLPVVNSSLLDDLSVTSGILGHSLCHSKSPFLSLSDDHYDKQLLIKNLNGPREELFGLNNSYDRTIHFWSLRLLYLGIHIHQHYPAITEAQSRYDFPCEHERQSLQLGSLDYECPSAKFLVVSMGRFGLGAVMRLGLVNAFIAGVATNRIVVIVNNAPVGPKFIQEPWLLASCPRRDYQCFYMAPTPCALTELDLHNGTVLSRGDTRRIFKSGQVPDRLEQERVLLVDLVLRPQRMPMTFRTNIHDIVMKHLVQPLESQRPHDERLPLFRLAAGQILEEEPLNESKYNYFGRDSKAHHALVFYAMRPNLYSNEKLDRVMNEIVPDDFDTNLALGLPIRASDKCVDESECLPFDKYMALMGRVWMLKQEEIMKSTANTLSASRMLNYKAVNDTLLTSQLKASIIVTSESPQIISEQKQYENQGLGSNFPTTFRFINNQYDHAQGTGNPSRMRYHLDSLQQTVSMDDIMLSSVSSLKLQMLARYSVGNCCSNFHLLLFDFLSDGCGAAMYQNSECLQDMPDPQYRLCCYWSKTDECLAKKQLVNQTQMT